MVKVLGRGGGVRSGEVRVEVRKGEGGVWIVRKVRCECRGLGEGVVARRGNRSLG